MTLNSWLITSVHNKLHPSKFFPPWIVQWIPFNISLYLLLLSFFFPQLFFFFLSISPFSSSILFLSFLLPAVLLQFFSQTESRFFEISRPPESLFILFTFFIIIFFVHSNGFSLYSQWIHWEVRTTNQLPSIHSLSIPIPPLPPHSFPPSHFSASHLQVFHRLCEKG